MSVWSHIANVCPGPIFFVVVQSRTGILWGWSTSSMLSPHRQVSWICAAVEAIWIPPQESLAWVILTYAFSLSLRVSSSMKPSWEVSSFLLQSIFLKPLYMECCVCQRGHISHAVRSFTMWLCHSSQGVVGSISSLLEHRWTFVIVWPIA